MATAVKEEPQWNSNQFQIDRFGLNVKPTNTNSILNAGSKLVGMFQGSPKLASQCQVDNCTVDVSKMKEYHSRYKICEAHLKASLVIKDGRPQRFCQQCGKFHDIAEFDGEKRSCRARLDKHNTRRRRQREMQHMLRTTGRIDETALRNKYGMTEEELAPKIQKLHKQMRFSNNPTSSATSQQSLSGQSGGSAGDLAAAAAAMPVPGLPGITQADLDLLGDGFLEDVLGPAALSMPAGPSGSAFANVPLNASGASGFMSIDPSSVMDLDDMAVLEELTREFGVNPNAAAMAAASGVASRHPASPSPFTAPGMAPFTAAQQAAAFPFLSSGMLTSALPQAALQSGSAGGNAPRTITTGMGGLPPYLQPSLAQPMAKVRSSDTSEASTVLEDALNLLAYDQSQVQYAVDDRMVRLSAKLFGCTPADLPADLKKSLQEMLAVDSMEGYMRPGCVHVEVNAMVPASSSEGQMTVTSGGMHAAVERFLATSPATATAAHTVMLQLGDKMAMVRDGKLLHVVNIAGAARLMPSVSAVRPLAVMPPSRGGSVTFSIWGYNLGKVGDVVLARSQGRHLETEVVGVAEELEEWGGLQRLEVRVKGPFAPGCLQLEVMRGSYATAARSVLVAPDAEIAGEVATLEATPDAGEVDTLIYELGSLVEAVHGGSAVASAMAAAPSPPGKAARRLLPFTVQRKWPALTRAALACVSLDTRTSEAMSEVDIIAVGTTGMSLLQLAVRTQSSDMLALLLNWARMVRHEFRSTTPGRRGLTALHLGALVRDNGLTAALLTAGCPDALHGWEGARAEDGSTPLGLATRFGTATELERVIAEAQYAQMQAKGGSAFAMACSGQEAIPATSSSHMSKGGLSIERLPSDMDDVALAKAAHKGNNLAQAAISSSLLTFASPTLEAKYATWYHTGQVPVDMAFMMITILSQMAWVLRWKLSHSVVLGGVMLALIAFNTIYLALAVLRPKAYVSRREWLCVASLLIHKVGQMMVTAMPGVGTIYSPTYNTTVALLESSSFAQIAMLSFGAKGRFAYFLPALVAMLPLSATINGTICRAAFPGASVAACGAGMFAFQVVACCALPAAAVYLSEQRSRRIFLRTAVA